ncbi:MAG: hypothetical protein ACI90V_011282, partial [Bacillariaceae sp.]
TLNNSDQYIVLVTRNNEMVVAELDVAVALLFVFCRKHA